MRFAISLVLLVSLAATVAATPAQDQTGTLQIGEREVRVVQQELYRRGYLQSRPTGVLDGETREALRAYQQREGLEVTGKIDRPTTTRLGLAEPLSINPIDEDHRPGVFPRIGSAVKNGAGASGRAVKGTAGKVARGVKGGASATADATSGAVDKTGDAAKSAGSATAGGARVVGRGVSDKASDVGEVFVGRSDADIHDDVREVLNSDTRTRYVKSEVKDGRVVLVSEGDSDRDLSSAVGRIRRLSGVKSVVVVDK
ncbi:MAG: peptidoglycan-binding protein [Acidobacteria bacterium]|nr:peptidoglycan-binding protein [Acidobacteriota bacterium]MCW5967371.1 peptidoglycan-binding protein [Blastocatellales bacterium]